MTVVKDNTAKVLAAIQKLASQEVLVGFPAEESGRDGGELNNAQIGYIHEYGSPAANIPARPFLESGVNDRRDVITRRLQTAAKAALDGNPEKVDSSLRAAGLSGQAGAMHRIDSSEFEPLKPETVRRRSKDRDTKSMRSSEKKYLELIASGATPEQAQDATGIRPLHNTGQLRNGIKYVIRRKE